MITLDRDIIGLFGKMNSGKSSLMNLLSQQETSIVDATPGTTTDTKITLSEIHGLGPVKFIDTAGFNEAHDLGAKKREKSLAALKECDLILLVIDPSTSDYETERNIITEAQKFEKQLILIYNLFCEHDRSQLAKVEDLLGPLSNYHFVVLNALDVNDRQKLLDTILTNYVPRNFSFDLLPFIEPHEFYILNIPMDDETPFGRLLRPQAMAEAYIIRKWAFPVAYRMNLAKARAGDPEEQKRWLDFIASFKKRPLGIITDSQAIDILKSWAPVDMKLTTFSVMMINYMSRGRLMEFVNGIKVLNKLRSGDRILIAEACNHSRIVEDIGTVQIPQILKKRYPEIIVEHSFGREFMGDLMLKKYKLIIHCGGCMISNQRMTVRLYEIAKLNVPITNYGIFLSFMQGEHTLDRVVAPWLDSTSN